MNPYIASNFTLCLLGLVINGAVAAQTPEVDFPNQRTRPASCESFAWNADMAREHPRITDACQEVVAADGTAWARLEARFVRVQSDGMVVFSVRDNRDRVVERMMMEPAAGQVAYLDGRATEFKDLTLTDRINLYVHEGEYGYATQPVATTPRFSRVVPIAETSEPEEISDPPANLVAANEARPLPAELPATAGFLPWLALVGSTLLVAAASMRLSRKL